jgi:hypothetical protein
VRRLQYVPVRRHPGKARAARSPGSPAVGGILDVVNRESSVRLPQPLRRKSRHCRRSRSAVQSGGPSHRAQDTCLTVESSRLVAQHSDRCKRAESDAPECQPGERTCFVESRPCAGWQEHRIAGSLSARSRAMRKQIVSSAVASSMSNRRTSLRLYSQFSRVPGSGKIRDGRAPA